MFSATSVSIHKVSKSLQDSKKGYVIKHQEFVVIQSVLSSNVWKFLETLNRYSRNNFVKKGSEERAKAIIINNVTRSAGQTHQFQTETCHMAI